MPARGGITSDSMLTITNLESHAHPSFVNVVTINAPQYGEHGEHCEC